MESRMESLWCGEKYVLGPMVRANSLPLRLACLEYGASCVYSEEIPCFRATSCKRYKNKALGTIDFLRGKGSSTEVLFRTHIALEKNKQCCVLQLGASESISALNAAKVFESDVAAIDINMGCPKHYSVSRGMGSELMVKPETAEDIIKTLKRNLNIPVSVKTRIFAKEEVNGICSNKHDIDIARSVEWVRRLQSCGADAVAVHARTAKEKNCDSTHDSEVYNILRDGLNATNTPLIYNGDIWGRADILRLRRDRQDWVSSRSTTQNDSSIGSPNSTQSGGCYMLSRAALWDPSVFATLRGDDGMVREYKEHDDATISDTTNTTAVPSLTQLLSRIISLSADTANCPLNTRYLIQQILAGRKQLHCPLRGGLLKVFDLHGLSRLLGDSGECEEYVYGEKMRQMMGVETEEDEEEEEEKKKKNVLTDEVNCEDDAASLSENNDTRTPQSTQSATNLATIHPPNSTNNTSKVIKPPSSRTSSLLGVQNSSTWPGLVSLTSHEYNDSYFDDNYYITFRKCTQRSEKRPFVFSQLTSEKSVTTGSVEGSVNEVNGVGKGSQFSLGLSYSTTTTVRVKKSKL